MTAKALSRLSTDDVYRIARKYSYTLLTAVFGTPFAAWDQEKNGMLLLLLILIVLLFAIAPVWPYSREWGYYPSGGLGTILVIVIVLVLLGYIHI